MTAPVEDWPSPDADWRRYWAELRVAHRWLRDDDAPWVRNVFVAGWRARVGETPEVYRVDG